MRYVKFEDADWKLEGANEPGLYPVLPNSRTWKLDKGRKHAVLKVSRKQIPLTPAFAITAHASQGKTLPPGRTQNATCTDGTTQQMHTLQMSLAPARTIAFAKDEEIAATQRS